MVYKTRLVHVISIVFSTVCYCMEEDRIQFREEDKQYLAQICTYTDFMRSKDEAHLNNVIATVENKANYDRTWLSYLCDKRAAGTIVKLMAYHFDGAYPVEYIALKLCSSGSF